VIHTHEAHICTIAGLCHWLLYLGTSAQLLSKIFSEQFLKQLLQQDMITVYKSLMYFFIGSHIMCFAAGSKPHANNAQ